MITSRGIPMWSLTAVLTTSTKYARLPVRGNQCLSQKEKKISNKNLKT